MAVTTSTTAGITSIIFTYKAATAQVTRIADQAAHYLFDVGYGEHGTEENPILYSSLTNAQKLAILDTYIFNVLMDARSAQDAKDGDIAKQKIIDDGRKEPPLTFK